MCMFNKNDLKFSRRYLIKYKYYVNTVNISYSARLLIKISHISQFKSVFLLQNIYTDFSQPWFIRLQRKL